MGIYNSIVWAFYIRGLGGTVYYILIVRDNIHLYNLGRGFFFMAGIDVLHLNI